MKAIILTESKQPECTVLPVPPVGEREVLVQVKAAGVCGSDIQTFFSDVLPPSYLETNVLGHEAAGVVTKVGTLVTDIQPGERAAIRPLIACKKCSRCTEGKEELCSELQSIGKTRAGAFAEYVTIPSENVRRLPPNISYPDAALTDVVAVAIHAIHLAELPSSKHILILGDGPVALACAQVLQLDNNAVTLIGKNEANISLARQLGVHAMRGDQKERKQVPPYDIAFECVGRRQSDTIYVAINNVKPGGKIIALGVFETGYRGQIEVRSLFYKEISLLGANSYGLWEGVDEFDIALSLILEGKVKPSLWITHQFCLEEVGELMHLIEHKSTSKLVKAVFCTIGRGT